MKQSDAAQGHSASESISKRVAELGDWLGKTLTRMRALIKEADPDVVEEWKWAKPTSPGTAVWSHDGMICTGEPLRPVPPGDSKDKNRGELDATGIGAPRLGSVGAGRKKESP